MTLPTITAAPTAPLVTDTPEVFDTRAFALAAWMEDLPTELNALSAAYADYLNSVLTAASATSLTIGTGSKAFTIGTGYAFTPGQRVRASSLADVTKYMEGAVTTYSGGVLTVNVDATGGSGTLADWQIGLTLSSALFLALAGGTMTGALITAASATGAAGIRVPPGVAPTSPVDGDWWRTASALYHRIGSVSRLVASNAEVQELFIPAAAMTSRTTSGAAQGTTESTTNKIMSKTLDFDAAAAEYAQFMLRMPKRWDLGILTFQFVWAATATGNVIWGGQAVALSDDDVLDAAFGTAQTVTDGVTATTDVMHSAKTSAATVAGTPAANDLVVFQVYRDAAAGGDTCAVDAKLLGVIITITTNAGDDT